LIEGTIIFRFIKLIGNIGILILLLVMLLRPAHLPLQFKSLTIPYLIVSSIGIIDAIVLAALDFKNLKVYWNLLRTIVIS
jgi:hypothetical protein